MFCDAASIGGGRPSQGLAVETRQGNEELFYRFRTFPKYQRYRFKRIRSLIIIKVTLMAFSMFSRGLRKKDKAFKVFNEGVALNLDAIDEQNRGDYEKAAALNRQSIDKFRETLELDSSHPIARSALGHSLYIDRQFNEAIKCFEQAIKKSDGSAVAAANYREMGLCKINLGELQEGKNDIDKAFSLDTGKEIRDLTIQDLIDIGELAFEYGDGYIQEGDVEKGQHYKKYGIVVLSIAFDYNRSRKDIALKIADLADKIEDKETATKYKGLSE